MNQFQTNELSSEVSPYLLQHAHNPIAWKTWNQETLALAKEANRPIFLSIGYATCHWCHVMEKESFEDQDFANYLNDHFICIKVDREERPDIDHLYMKACQAITGQGGWPLTCFLSSEGAPLFAGTYFPLEDKHGRPGVKRLSQAIADMWIHKNEQLMRDSAKILQVIARDSAVNEDESLVVPRLLESTAEELRTRFDPKNGGFGHSPKFPTPHNLLYLIRQHAQNPDDMSAHVITHTLDKMAQKGLRDHLAGGFFRYSTDAAWHIPHFEKMLYDNALLLFVYAEASVLFNRSEYAQICGEIVSYLNQYMKVEEAFASAEDADSEGIEGAFYTWTLSELEERLDEDLAAFRLDFDLGPEGEFVEPGHAPRNVWHLQRKHSFFSNPSVQESLNKLLKARDQRPRPLRDDKILLDWNSLYIAALAKAGKILHQPSWVEQAQKSYQWILANLRTSGGDFLHRWRNQQAALPAHLEDYAYLIWACLELHQATGEQKFLIDSIRYAALVDRHFKDPETGAYFFSDQREHSLILRTIEFYDGALPSGQGVLSWIFMRLYNQTGKEHFHQNAQDIFKAYGERLQQNPSSFCFLMMGLHLFYKGIPTITTNQPLPFPFETKRFLPDLDLIFINSLHPHLPPYLVEVSTTEPFWLACNHMKCSLPHAEFPSALEDL